MPLEPIPQLIPVYFPSHGKVKTTTAASMEAAGGMTTMAKNKDGAPLREEFKK